MADILVIDDEAAVRRLLSRALKRAGHTPHEAANGREGIAAFRRIRPALVICDIVMPDIEGIETIRTMRREAPDTPVIAASGSDVPLYLRLATGAGAAAALKKPFKVEELLSLVSEHLGAAS